MDNLEWNETPEENLEPVPEPRQENTYCPPEPEEAPEQTQPVEAPAAPVRKPSIFADSPYVTVVPPAPVEETTAQPEPTPEPVVHEPVKPPKKEKSSMSPAMMLVLAGAFVLIAVTFAINNNRLNNLKQDYDRQLLAYAEKLERLEESKVQAPGSNGPSRPQVDLTPDASGMLTPAQVYAQCVDSVVAINCTGSVRHGFGQTTQTASSGSGFILSEDGYVVTNFHVVESQQKLEVITNDGTKYTAEYIGGNEANDIALLKVDAQDLPYVSVGSAADMVVGEQVVAIGNPLGELASTLTVGYLSAKDRIVTSEGTQINMLQTDAAINPGNSGGPLFNMYGQVVGITSAKYSGTTDSGATIEGIGFAIPMDDVMNMLDDLRNHGYITGGYLGVSVSEVGEEASELYGLPKGVLVREVTSGSCAENAGIRVQDIIVSLAGYKIENLNDLTRALNKCKGGDEVSVIVYRSGAEKTLTVVLDERPLETEPAVTEPPTESYYSPWPGDSFIDDFFGGFFG